MLSLAGAGGSGLVEAILCPGFEEWSQPGERIPDTGKGMQRHRGVTVCGRANF